MCDHVEDQISDVKVDDSLDASPLSPIVGYTFYSDGDEESLTSSEEDPETEEYVRTLNARLSLIAGKEIEPEPGTPRSEKRKRLRKRLSKSRKKEAQADLIKRQKLSFEPEVENLESVSGEAEKSLDLKKENEPEPILQDLEKVETVPLVIHSKNAPGFKTASGKFVSVSKKALEFAGHLFKSVEASEDSPILKPDPPGFKKANKKLIPISHTAVEKAAAMFDTIGTDEDNADKEKAMPPGFKTASGKFVPVSKKALEFAGHLFKSVEASEDSPIVKPDPPGFKKANKKFIPISHTAVEKAAAMFDTIGTDEDNADEEKAKPPGFKTANGKFVPVSKKALAAVKGLQSNVATPGTSNPSDKRKQNNTGVGEMTQEINDCIMALLADDADESTDFA